MAKKSNSSLLSGTVQHLLFSPKGGVEGLLIKVAGEVVQVSFPPYTGATLSKKAAPGKRLRLLAVLDTSPKAARAMHSVYQFEALADASGQAIAQATDDGMVAVKGKVARIHFAKHGEPNGVVLESGEFVHLRPHGMEALGLDIGSRLSARGELRMTVLGTPLLEARHANGYDIE